VSATRPPAGHEHTHLREDEVSSETVFQGRLLEVRCDHVRLPDGGVATREYVVHPGAVMVVPLLDDGRLVMERQWRYPLNRAMLEFPAGKLERGEAPFTCAVRELHEETGYTAREWGRAGLLHNAIAYSTEGIEVWFARGLTLGERQLDAGEFLDVQLVTSADLDRHCAEGRVTDAKTLVGLLWLQNWQSGRWAIDWQASP
jgi:ADP-ribose pyrophosphatase